ncbi:MAG: UvrD-helicase domain-containing protein, partial [Candidatus Melainabacteria bacterium]|nr:UvrD-helicase domain-containing protein [Candidatus Melainabacteria bacterium]
AKVYQSYEDQLQRANRIDRDDMVGLAVQMLLERPDIRAKYQCRFEFVLVDEYQDVTLAQDTFVRLLAAPQDNLFLAGNDDEAIYETRGARPELLVNISHRFPTTRCYVLEKNWRCQKPIIDHATLLLNGIQQRRITKEILWTREQSTNPAIVGPQCLANEKAETDWVAQQIHSLVKGGQKACDIAVLYRFHHYESLLEDRLASQGLRCVASQPDVGVVPDEVEDMMAFLKLVGDPDGPKAKELFERVCQLRAKEVDAKLSLAIASFAEANNLSYLKAVEIYSEATADQSCRELEQVVRLLRTMHQEKLPPAETISLIRRTQRLNEYYRSVHVPPGVNYEPLRKLTYLEEEAKKFKSVSEFVKQHTLARQQEHSASQAGDGGIHVLSLHKTKGLEFPVVFMVGLAEGLFPAESAPDPDEERRLCYLGLTRARDILYVSYPAMFNNIALQPSSFLLDSRLLSSSPTVESTKQPTQQATKPVVTVPPVRLTAQPPLQQSRSPKVVPAKGSVVSEQKSQPKVAESVEPIKKPTSQVSSARPASESVPGARKMSAQLTGSGQPTCPSCTATLESGAQFCGECGHNLGTRIPACPLCCLPLEPSAKFCGECGTHIVQAQVSKSKPLSPAGVFDPQAGNKRDQHGWLVKLLKFLEPS